MQQVEVDKWRDMSKKEKKVFQDTLDYLGELRRDLAYGKVSWDDPNIAPDPAKEIEELPRKLRLARKTQQGLEESNKKKAAVVNPSESEYWIDAFQAEQEAAAAALSTNGNARGRAPRVTSTSRAASQTPPPPGSDENTNPDPNPNQNAVTPDEEYDNEEDGESYTGLGSTDEKRAAEAAKTSVKANSRGGKKKRKIGTWGSLLHHQVDSVSEDAIKQAYVAVALANATLHVPGRTSGQPGRKLMLIEINECNDTKAHGGRPTEAGLTRKKPLVVVSGATNRDDVGDVVDHLVSAFKHEKSKTHVRVELNGSQGDFEAVTRSYFDARAKARSQPSTTPVPLTQIRDERHERQNQMRRRSL
jgi:hypothetical protein